MSAADALRNAPTATDDDALWQRACDCARSIGLDPDAMLADAVANVARYQALSPAERAAEDEAATERWLAWEATVDDMGRPLR